MSEPVTVPTAQVEPQEARIRRSWLVLLGSFLVLAAIAAVRLVGEFELGDMLLAAMVVVVAVAGARHRDAVRALEAGRRSEAESFARILRGLSRSVSADAIVDAIVRELAGGTDADHVVVARRRPGAPILDATLVSRRPGVPSSSTLLPISDLDDPLEPGVTAGPRERVAIPVGVMPEPLAVAVATQPPRDPLSRVLQAVSTVGTLDDLTAGVRGDPRHARPAQERAAADGLVAERIAARVRDVYGLRHTLAAPLRTDDGMIGAIVVSRRTAEPWPEWARRLLAGAAVEASAALARAYSHRDAEERASTDALTGLPNRRYFDEFCGLLARRRRAGDAVGVLMIDIDKFKAINDRVGHGAGDEVLRAVAGAIASAVREDDVPARYGGEEFAVLLRNPGQGVAIDVGERVRIAVRELDLSRSGVGTVSVSVGVAVATVPDQPIDEIVERADKALYEAKRRGRDRVVLAPS